MKTPCTIIDLKQLRKNCEILKSVIDKTNCKILLALKGFSTFATFNLVSQYLSGVTASSAHETRLGHEEFNGELHCYFPAYSQEDMDFILPIADHLVFNSCSQLNTFKQQVKNHNVSFGLRVNHQYSEVKTDLYNPSAPFSRLGVTLEQLKKYDISDIDGLHFHSLCQNGADSLERTLEAFEKQFKNYLPNLKWLNFGGGHHITRQDYDIEKLINCIDYYQNKYNLQVILEPSEAIALNAGVLRTTVLDIVHNKMDIAILNTSPTAHMPDVLEMPYRPQIIGSGKENEKQYTYRLAGVSCLSGDIIGNYSFDKKLQIGDEIDFEDMAIYTTVKQTTFNGIALPSIALKHENGNIEIIKEFNYQDFKGRLS